MTTQTFVVVGEIVNMWKNITHGPSCLVLMVGFEQLSGQWFCLLLTDKIGHQEAQGEFVALYLSLLMPPLSWSWLLAHHIYLEKQGNITAPLCPSSEFGLSVSSWPISFNSPTSVVKIPSQHFSFSYTLSPPTPSSPKGMHALSSSSSSLAGVHHRSKPKITM